MSTRESATSFLQATVIIICQGLSVFAREGKFFFPPHTMLLEKPQSFEVLILFKSRADCGRGEAKTQAVSEVAGHIFT